MDLSDQLERAEGYIDLGMHEDAWNCLEELPAIDRVMPEVINLRLRICLALERWEMGASLANVLATSVSGDHRRNTAQFYHAYARHLCSTGMTVLAKEQVRLAVAAWEEIRREIVEDDKLEAIWNLLHEENQPPSTSN